MLLSVHRLSTPKQDLEHIKDQYLPGKTRKRRIKFQPKKLKLPVDIVMESIEPNEGEMKDLFSFIQ
jgi:hypothetical protein